MNRPLMAVHSAQPTQDGAGVAINRIGGSAMQRLLDPFLMVDEINSAEASDYLAGFPEHPHRGFETITYMKVGRMRHRDHMGNEGVIGSGDVQWMTAGRGVIHSEMPEQQAGLMHGFQIWLNLPAADKLVPAAYREIGADQLERFDGADGSAVALIAGQLTVVADRHVSLHGQLPAMATQPLLADLTVAANQQLELVCEGYEQVALLVYDDSTDQLGCKQLGLYGEGDRLVVQGGSAGCQALLLAGQPLREPIAQYGPFVMNTTEQLEQALRDFRDGRLAE